MHVRKGLTGEIIGMAWESLRTHKMRSALTVLGIVIGITMVVGVTSLIRGFDSTITGQIQDMGPDVMFVAKFSIQSLTSGQGFRELLSRPDIDHDDARVIREQATTVLKASMLYQEQGGGRGGPVAWYRGKRTSGLSLQGVSPEFLEGFGHRACLRPLAVAGR